MNEKKICACVGARTRDTQKSKEHYEENFIPAGWNLEYTCLDQPEAARALYLTGVCLHCGGQLGKKFNIPGELTGDALLEQIYHQMESCRPFDQRFDGGAYRTSLSMRAYWYMEQDDLTLGAKNAQFLKLFHAEDQGVVEDWISRCHAEEPYGGSGSLQQEGFFRGRSIRSVLLRSSERTLSSESELIPSGTKQGA